PRWAAATPAARPASRPSGPTARRCSPRSSPGSGATRTSSTGSGGCWSGAGPSPAGGGAAPPPSRSSARPSWACWPPRPGSAPPGWCWPGPTATGRGCWSRRWSSAGRWRGWTRRPGPRSTRGALGGRGLGPGPDEPLEAVWEEVAKLHRAGMAHGDLGRHSVVVDEAGRPWLVDFDHAVAAAPERLRQADLVELAVSLAVRFGTERALAGAAVTVGRGPLAAALAATAPPTPPPTRRSSDPSR